MTEQEVGQIAIDWFRDLGYDYASGLDIAPDGPAPERKTRADIQRGSLLGAALAGRCSNPPIDRRMSNASTTGRPG